jgi:alpha-L-rhamnosidase
VVKSLDHARASVPTVRGEAAINWRRDVSRLAMDVTVPANATARIVIPAAAASATISEGGTPLWKGGAYRAGVAGITSARAADGGVVVEAGSGRYRFAAE